MKKINVRLSVGLLLVILAFLYISIGGGVSLIRYYDFASFISFVFITVGFTLAATAKDRSPKNVWKNIRLGSLMGGILPFLSSLFVMMSYVQEAEHTLSSFVFGMSLAVLPVVYGAVVAVIAYLIEQNV